MSSWDYPQEVHAISASGNAHPASYPTPELSYSPPQSPGGGDQDDNDLVDLPASSSAGGKGKGKSGSRRRKSNADEPSSVLSRFNILATPLANKKNAECQVVVYHAGKAPEPCGAWLTYASKDGPRSLVRHLERFHAGEYELYLKQRNTRRSQDKGKDTPSKSAKRKASDSHAGGGSKRPAAKEGKKPSKKATSSSAGGRGPRTTSASSTASNKTLGVVERRAVDRKFVIMSAIDMRTENVARQEGHRLFLGHFSPDYASDPMDETKFDQLLAAVCLEVKSDVINHLQRQREGCLLHGYDGPFCGIRVDMTHVGQVAYGTASCSIIPTNFSEVVHLVLGTRSFQGHHLDKQLQLWLKKLTLEYFSSFTNELVQPRDVFICGTADQGETALNAFKGLDVPGLVCAVDRVNSSIMWALGISAGSAPGSNVAGGEVVSRAASLIRTFSYHAIGIDGTGNAQDAMRSHRQQQGQEQQSKEAADMESLETLAGLLPIESTQSEDGSGRVGTAKDQEEEMTRTLEAIGGGDPRFWGSALYEFLRGVVDLRPTVDAYFQEFPAYSWRNLSDAGWTALRQLISLLEPASEVTIRIQGAADGFVSRTIYLMKEVRDIYEEEEQDVLPASMAEDDPTELMHVSSLSSPAQEFLKIIAQDMGDRGLGEPDSVVSRVGLYLDPRTKSCGPGVCSDGGAHVKAQAIAEIERHAVNLAKASGLSPGPADDMASSNFSGAPPQTKRPRSMLERRELNRAVQAGAAAGHARRARAPAPVQHELKRELGEYEASGEVFQGSGFDLLQFWKEKATPKIDEVGNVMQPARWPTLAMFARIYHGVSGTSRATTEMLSNLRRATGHVGSSVSPRKSEQMLFLQGNAGLIREVNIFEAEAAAREQRINLARKKASAAQQNNASDIDYGI